MPVSYHGERSGGRGGGEEMGGKRGRVEEGTQHVRSENFVFIVVVIALVVIEMEI